MSEAAIQTGTLIKERYKVERVLGQGGFGRTYLASNLECFGELCALKEFVPTNLEEYKRQKSRELFDREAQVLHEIKHEQIPKFRCWFTYRARVFIVQEYIKGKTYTQILRERKQQGQVFSEAEVIQWLIDLLPVLSYLHEQGIIHRDISPDNVMLPDGESRPMLIDFGLVKEKVTQLWDVSSSSPSSSANVTMVGKHYYAPMEQVLMGQCFPSSDLYALAVTALVLLSGEEEPNVLIDPGSLEWRWQSHVKVSDQVGRILDKMLKRIPNDRYQSAQEVLAELQ